MAKYDVSFEQEKEIIKRFSYHPPKDDQAQRYEILRSEFRYMAKVIYENSPVSREQSLALTKLEEAMMAANAAIARNE